MEVNVPIPYGLPTDEEMTKRAEAEALLEVAINGNLPHSMRTEAFHTLISEYPITFLNASVSFGW